MCVCVYLRGGRQGSLDGGLILWVVQCHARHWLKWEYESAGEDGKTNVIVGVGVRELRNEWEKVVSRHS